MVLIAQHLNVHQRKLGTIIIHTDQILQHDSAETGSLLKRNFNIIISQITSYKTSQVVVRLHLYWYQSRRPEKTFLLSVLPIRIRNIKFFVNSIRINLPGFGFGSTYNFFTA
jgi:hypothetical protein